MRCRRATSPSDRGMEVEVEVVANSLPATTLGFQVELLKGVVGLVRAI